MTTSASIYAKPVAPRIIVRPALATLALHALILALLLFNWGGGKPDTIVIKPQPQVINARLIDASELKPKPAPAPKAAAKPQPKPVAQPKPKPKAAPKPKPKTVAQPKPAPVATPQPKPAPAEPETPRLTQQELAALARADIARAVAEEDTAAAAAATSAELAASYAALIQQTVINYWSRPPSARNGMETLLSIRLVPTGEVVSVSVVRGSGNRAFDQSAVNAVKKAGSFPELQNLPPREFEKSFRQLSLLFRPEDLRY